MALAWYLGRTRPLAEYRARDRLTEGGVENFLPVVFTPSPQQGGKEVPLFPSYLFVRHDLDKWGTASLRRVPEFAGLVGFGGVIPSVPEEVIHDLRQRVAEMGEDGGDWTRYRPGSRVLICLAPHDEERFAVVAAEANSPKGRVRVLLEFMGQQAHAEVPWLNLRPAGDGYQGDAGRNRFHRRTRGRGRYLQGMGPRAPFNNERSLT